MRFNGTERREKGNPFAHSQPVQKGFGARSAGVKRIDPQKRGLQTERLLPSGRRPLRESALFGFTRRFAPRSQTKAQRKRYVTLSLAILRALKPTRHSASRCSRRCTRGLLPAG